MAVAGTYEQSAGVEQLYFPAFDSPATNNGIAEGLDGERIGQIYETTALKNFIFTGAYGAGSGNMCRRRHSARCINEQQARRADEPIAIRWPMLEYSRSIGTQPSDGAWLVRSIFL